MQRFKTGNKSLGKCLVVRTGKRPKHPREVGVQQGSQENHGYQQLLPAPWPCKRLKSLSDHQTGNIPVWLQNSNPVTTHFKLLLRVFLGCCSFEAEIEGILPGLSWKSKCWKIQFYFHLLVGKKTTTYNSEKAVHPSNNSHCSPPALIKTFIFWTPTAMDQSLRNHLTVK